MRALIGHTGFVGTVVKRQAALYSSYRSTDISSIRGEAFDLVVCSGVPAQKWIAERDPAGRHRQHPIVGGASGGGKAKQFVLISTVDVFADSRGKDEDSVPDEAALTAYGRNRLWLERFATDRFSNALVVRLCGLVGPGLRKNAVFDFRNNNALHAISSQAVYQFYPMVNLWNDIGLALGAGLKTLHLTAEPLSIRDMAREAFGLEFDNVVEGRAPAAYELPKPVMRPCCRRRRGRHR